MYVIFILTLAVLLVSLKNKIARRNSVVLDEFASLENKFKELSAREGQLKQENVRREEDLVRISNIYEVAKDISEFLEDTKIFLSFKKGLAKFVHFQECEYLAKLDSRENFSGFEIITLQADTDHYGYLAMKGLRLEEKETLDILIAQFIASLKRAHLYQRVQELSITDSLTKISTRKYCLDRLAEELQRSKELDLSLSFLMIDLDNFKTFNDRYGHLVGDVILKTIAEIIKSSCREIDLIGRFGGEEFMVILPMTPPEGALFAAERIRRFVESTPVRAFDEQLNVTISVGISNFPHDSKTIQGLIDKADIALYHSKNSGKNNVTTYSSALDGKK